MPMIFDPAQLNTVGVEHAQEYQSGDPFPHIVIDGLFPEPVLRDLIDAFPGPEDAVWAQHNNQREVKLALRDEKMMPEPHLQILRELNGQAFIRFLEAMTGIEGL